ncbi:MAG: hypothetical protein RL196_145 [Actinomycetota bacterium]|jgi:uncharacterized membrane protein YgaE (UPF0421/DUF939 family)
MSLPRIKPPKLHWSLRESTHRVAQSVAPILQITLGAMAAFSIAHFGLGHAMPVLSVTVTISALGFTRDARPRRVAETAIGMVTGILVSEFLLNLVGAGVWQIGLTLMLSLFIARFMSSSSAFALSAGIQSMLVFILIQPGELAFSKTIDALIGASIALVATALIPRDPRGLANSDAGKLFDTFLEVLNALKLALVQFDVKTADATLVKVRRTQPLVDNWRLSLDSAIAISRISPFLRKYRDELSGQVRLMRGMDLATRNLRVIVRRVDFLLRDTKPRPYLGQLIEQIAEGTLLLKMGLEEPERLLEARELLLEVMHQLDPKRFGIADQLREASVLLLLRPLLIDLLCASGMAEEDARAELPVI